MPYNSSILSQGVAGHTYLGQLLSHDLNLDLSSKLGVQVDPTTLPNFVTPLADLDTIYGIKALNTEALIKDGKFLLGLSESGQPVDYPRDENKVALIADQRNDNNKVIAQITTVRTYCFFCFIPLRL